MSNVCLQGDGDLVAYERVGDGQMGSREYKEYGVRIHINTTQCCLHPYRQLYIVGKKKFL